MNYLIRTFVLAGCATACACVTIDTRHSREPRNWTAKKTAEEKIAYNEFYKNSRQEGKFYVSLGLPYVNTIGFAAETPGRTVAQTGFVGLSAGMEYHFTGRWSVAGEGWLLAAVFAPIGPIDYVGEREWNNAAGGSVSFNYHLDRFSFGAGPCLTRYIWRYSWDCGLWGEEKETHVCDPVAESEYGLPEGAFNATNALGGTLNAYWKVGITRIGAVYRPTFYNLGHNGGFTYAHSISLDIKFLINTGKKLRPARRFIW